MKREFIKHLKTLDEEAVNQLKTYIMTRNPNLAVRVLTDNGIDLQEALAIMHEIMTDLEAKSLETNVYDKIALLEKLLGE